METPVEMVQAKKDDALPAQGVGLDDGNYTRMLRARDPITENTTDLAPGPSLLSSSWR
jgi:hypothetical protein